MDANASQGTGHRRSPVAACLPRDVACTLIRRLPEHLSHDRQEAIAAGFKAEAFSSAIKSDVSSFIAKCIVIATCSGMGSDPALEQRGTEAVAPSGSQSGRARSSSRSAGCQHRRRSCSWLAEGERGSTTYAPRCFSKKKKQSGGMAGAMWSMSLTDTPQAKKSSRQCRTHRRVDRSPRASPADKPKRPACDRRFQVLLPGRVLPLPPSRPYAPLPSPSTRSDQTTRGPVRRSQSGSR